MSLLVPAASKFGFQHCHPGFQTRRWVFLGGVHVCGAWPRLSASVRAVQCTCCYTYVLFGQLWVRLRGSPRLRTCGRQYLSSCSLQLWASDGWMACACALLRVGAKGSCFCVVLRAWTWALNLCWWTTVPAFASAAGRVSGVETQLGGPLVCRHSRCMEGVQWGHHTAVLGDRSQRWPTAPLHSAEPVVLCAGGRRGDKGRCQGAAGRHPPLPQGHGAYRAAVHTQAVQPLRADVLYKEAHGAALLEDLFLRECSAHVSFLSPEGLARSGRPGVCSF